MKEIPTIEEIRDNILSNIKSKLYTEKAGIPMLERSVWKILATAFSGIISNCYQNSRYIYRQLFTATADLDSLEFKGEQYGIFLKQGTKTTLTVQFTGEANSKIPKNTQLIFLDSVYLTDDLYIISENGLTLGKITSVETGEKSVKAIGETINIMTPVAGVSEIAVVVEILKKGKNAETVDSFRNRIQTFERSRPQGGAIPDFINWSLEVDGVIKTFVERSNTKPRIVTVYPLAAITGDGRLPDNIKLKEVESYLNDPVRCPPCIVEAKKMKELVVDITVNSLQPATNSLKEIIKVSFENYLYGLYPSQYIYEENVKNFLDNSGLMATALLSGASAIDLDITITGGRTSPYQLKINEIAKLGDVIWKV